MQLKYYRNIFVKYWKIFHRNITILTFWNIFKQMSIYDFQKYWHTHLQKYIFQYYFQMLQVATKYFLFYYIYKISFYKFYLTSKNVTGIFVSQYKNFTDFYSKLFNKFMSG